MTKTTTAKPATPPKAERGRPIVDPDIGARTTTIQIRAAPVTRDLYKAVAKEQGMTLANWMLTELDYAAANNSPGCLAKRSSNTKAWIEVCNQLVGLTVELEKQVEADNHVEIAALNVRINELRKERDRLEAIMQASNEATRTFESR